MKIRKFTHAIAVLLSSIASLFAHGGASKAEPAKTKFSKKSERAADDRVLDVSSLAFTPGQFAANRTAPGQRYPWKTNGPKRRALFRGLKKGTRDRPYLLAKTDGSRSAKAIEPRMRNGKTPDH